LELTGTQVEQIFLVLVGFLAFTIIVLIVNYITKSRGSSADKKLGKKSGKKEPQYEEIFEVENEIIETNPYKNDPDTYFEQSVLQTVTLTLIVGLQEHLTKMAENPSDQHKAMKAIGKYLEEKSVAPIAFTQWSQSAIQGIAARVILNGKSRTALFGPSVAMAKATAKFPSEISAQVESAHAVGESVFVLAIDGLAYGVFSVSHRLVLIGSGDRI
jgi:ABC-type transport system involved in Fe-S cluster assembly fused permease/ATPase subunit